MGQNFTRNWLVPLSASKSGTYVHSPASNVDKDVYELSVTSEPSVPTTRRRQGPSLKFLFLGQFFTRVWPVFLTYQRDFLIRKAFQNNLQNLGHMPKSQLNRELLSHIFFKTNLDNNFEQWQVRYGQDVYTGGWNLPGSTSLLSECHQIMCKADVLLGSFFQRNARILLRSFDERRRTENM